MERGGAGGASWRASLCVMLLGKSTRARLQKRRRRSIRTGHGGTGTLLGRVVAVYGAWGRGGASWRASLCVMLLGKSTRARLQKRRRCSIRTGREGAGTLL